MKRTVAIAVPAVLLATLAATPAAAVPVDPAQVVTLHQPGGRALKVKPFGDEWNHGFRTRNGYTIVRNAKTRRWEYAVKEADGGLRASGVRTGASRPARARPRLLDADGRARPRDLNPGVRSTHAPAIGTHRSLVILVQFANQASLGTTPAPVADAASSARSHSVADYYDEVSYGALDVVPATESFGTANDGIVGWLTLPGNHPNANNLKDAAALQRAQPDRARTRSTPPTRTSTTRRFSTQNGNNILSPDEPHITVIPAGWEGSAQCGTPGVWGHKYGTGALHADGRRGVRRQRLHDLRRESTAIPTAPRRRARRRWGSWSTARPRPRLARPLRRRPALNGGVGFWSDHVLRQLAGRARPPRRRLDPTAPGRVR